VKQLINRLTINKTYYLVGEVSDFEIALNNTKGIRHQVDGVNEFCFSPTASWGTLSGPIFNSQITVRALVAELDDGRVKINFRTRVRIEHYFLIILFIIFFICFNHADESPWVNFFLLGVWIIFHVWFHFIYRYQENRLIEKLVEKLRLREM
jgi:hypothetical protein